MPTDISIIIPLFNKEDFIVQTLKSILNQDNKDWECIIVDDGSAVADPVVPETVAVCPITRIVAFAVE